VKTRSINLDRFGLFFHKTPKSDYADDSIQSQTFIDVWEVSSFLSKFINRQTEARSRVYQWYLLISHGTLKTPRLKHKS
jgi:hypothetical protein